jgi:hypothetical protein
MRIFGRLRLIYIMNNHHDIQHFEISNPIWNYQWLYEKLLGTHREQFSFVGDCDVDHCSHVIWRNLRFEWPKGHSIGFLQFV